MADTERTATDLLANLFQDGQAADSITAQDIRDFIVSVRPHHAAMHLSAVAATVIAVAGTFVKVAGTTSLPVAAHGFTMPVSNQLKFTGTADRHMQVICTVSVTVAANNQDIEFQYARNGVLIAPTGITQRIGNGADQQAVVVIEHCDVVLGDEIELFVTNLTSSANVTIEDMYMTIQTFLV